ncbi:acyl carrier protein [Hymenobacter sp. YC55]|uniref:acyl carrier protein n=1 Tax=Hymenobacter sp. YC55 TaxID=3034019 RepID=UPI0023F67124|nr:acyl carrier protein [Hymenobacter sp. YC55]MDF7811183.1 acyl carrier protein [Hymenobacter sp. YC55]
MISVTSFVFKSLIQLVLRLVSMYKIDELKQQSLNLRPSREISFDLLDFIDCLFDLEGCFHIPIPDEVPLFTIDDLFDYVATSLRRWASYDSAV